jgi:hypothetical protein
MKQMITKVVQDPEFILNELNIPFILQWATLSNYKYNTGQKTGLYIIFDDNLDVVWYIGKSLSPGGKKGGIYDRIKKHIDRALGTYNQKHHTPMRNWFSLQQWIDAHNYPFINNGQVAFLEIDMFAFSNKKDIDDAETQLILDSVFYSYCNSETYHFSRFDRLSPGSNIPPKILATLNKPIGW